MGVEIKLTDRDLPVSPALVDFLHRRIHGRAAEALWHDQVSEVLVPAEAEKRVEHARDVAESVIAHPVGQQVIFRAYELFAALLTGDEAKLAAFQRRFRFILVVGCPRHGGTYLTKQLFRALGQDPTQVPNVIAHDGFPDAAPFGFGAGYSAYTHMLLQTAEYLAMVEAWFGDRPAIDGKIIVPKKATKAAYQGGFFRTVFGADAEYIITLRHPLAACISTYEKSGGLPADGLFAARSNIEVWAQRDLQVSGMAQEQTQRMRYIDGYLGYWRYYHLQLAGSGLASDQQWRVVAYGRDRLMRLAEDLNRRFGVAGAVEDFQVERKLERHRDWNGAAAAALHQIEAIWSAQGLPFPASELAEGW
ncbi:MAG: hypothetical protein K2X06_04680 [Burkholderiales bacterium]|nr:hypothetical protein [Burkholderiales bacterium]